ncbi:MAG TPA: glucoamylase family protein [Flavisolibacter sp.]|nr:glucoamylase family protein [Flavisolibacter sp.]
MKIYLVIIQLLFFIACQGQEPAYNYQFFVNSRMERNYFYSKVVTEGTSYVNNEKGRLPVSDSQFFTPGNSLQLQYKNSKQGNWKAFIYKPQFRGQDHFKASRFLSFHLFTKQAISNNNLPYVQLLLQDSSLTKKVAFTVKSSNKWELINIPLDEFGKGVFTDPWKILGIVFSQQGVVESNHRLFLDDIAFTSTIKSLNTKETPSVQSIKGYARHIVINWKAVSDSNIKYVKIYRSENGKQFQPVGIQTMFINTYSDYVGVTGRSYQYKISFLNSNYQESALSKSVKAATRSMSDEELMDMVQEACFRYYWDGAEANSGLAKENIPGRHTMVASGASGFGIMALLVGAERKFITRQQLVDRFKKIIGFLEKAQTFHGAFPHFIAGNTGKVEPFFGKRDNGGDLVETSFLLQGLIAARAYFKENNKDEEKIREGITSIWERVEWSWYRRFPDSKFLYWHWSPDQAWIINHRLIGWNETMITYLLAIASPTHPVPASLYYSGWANQDSTGQQYRTAWGGTKEGSMYTNGNSYYGIKLDVGVSNGGPLFFTHYSYMGYDPHQLTDRYTNYFTNNQHIAQINLQYCMANPHHYKGYGDSCWGLTASDGPFDYSADEPVFTRDQGKIAPTGALSSFPYTPRESMNALKNYYYNYGNFLWGEYGFRDAFDLNENWCSDIYMGLNQAPIVVMMENYRTGFIWKLFMSDKDVQNGLSTLNKETAERK